ncbi:MAG: Gfo/Idh/MocA family oxidoreductase [Pseudomonadota bacterium]
MKIVTSGAGLRAGHVLQKMLAAMPEAKIVGYHDPAPGHLDMIGGDAIPAYPSVGDMLAETQPDLFCVFSPNCFHLDQIREGLEAGVQVFAEKPIVTTMEDSFALAELLAKHGANRVMVGLVLRYSSQMVDLRAAMADGALGTIASMEANEHIGPYHGAFFMRDWRRHTKLSGGFMLEKCCHDLDIYNMIANARPARVASFGARRSFVPENAPGAGEDASEYHRKASIWESAEDPFTSDGDIIDSQTALIEYESGASLAFHTNLNVPDEHRRFCVIGSRGMAEGDFLRGYLNVTDARSGKRLVANDYSANATNEGHYGADERMARDVAAFLRDETDTLPVSVLDALEAGIAALAIDEARQAKRVVELGDHWARLDALGLRQ